MDASLDLHNWRWKHTTVNNLEFILYHQKKKKKKKRENVEEDAFEEMNEC